jgi:hypothetical protein
MSLVRTLLLLGWLLINLCLVQRQQPQLSLTHRQHRSCGTYGCTHAQCNLYVIMCDGCREDSSGEAVKALVDLLGVSQVCT